MNDELTLIQELNEVLPLEIINEIFSYRIMTATARIMNELIEQVKEEWGDFNNPKEEFCYYLWGGDNSNLMLHQGFMKNEINQSFYDEEVWETQKAFNYFTAKNFYSIYGVEYFNLDEDAEEVVFDLGEDEDF
jgi:hypothetical protein